MNNTAPKILPVIKSENFICPKCYQTMYLSNMSGSGPLIYECTNNWCELKFVQYQQDRVLTTLTKKE